MSLDKIINAADQAYPDGLVALYHDKPKEDHGDTLAKFIAIELAETNDPDRDEKAQIQDAINAMENAQHEIENVINALYRAKE